jgi:hypothetical protein
MHFPVIYHIVASEASSEANLPGHVCAFEAKSLGVSFVSWELEESILQ